MSRGMHLGHVAVESVSSPISAAFDGKYVWVTNSGATKVFEVWANSTSNLGIDAERKVVEVASVAGASNCSFLTYGNGYMWIAKKSSVSGRSTLLYDTILKVNVLTKEVEETIRTPISQTHKAEEAPWGHTTHEYVMMNSVLHYCDGKLWMVDDYEDALANGSQRVWIYDTATSVWSFQTFAAKTQKNRAQIASMNGFVYISAYNSVAVLKYNAATNAFVTSIRGNANPNALCSTPDNKIMVTSSGGLISYLNADDSWNHDLIAETEECTQIVFESPTQFWALDGQFIFRVGTDHYTFSNKYANQDYNILTANSMPADDELYTRADITTSPLWDFDKRAIQGDMVDLTYTSLNGYSFSSSIDHALVIQEIDYLTWNRSAMVATTQPRLLVLLTDSEIVVINTSEIKFGFPRPSIARSTMSAVGVGMISFGPNDYTGD